MKVTLSKFYHLSLKQGNWPVDRVVGAGSSSGMVCSCAVNVMGTSHLWLNLNYIYIAQASEELHFTIYFILINLRLKLGSFTWLVATVPGSVILEC